MERVVFRNEENGYSVVRLQIEKGHESGETVMVVGTFASARTGENIRATGRWVNHPRFGMQFKAERVESVRPTSTEGIRQYLGSGVLPGVGPQMAERIVAKFRDKTLEVMDHHIDALLQVSGIGKKKLKAVKEVWESLRGSREAFIFLQEIGLSPLMANKVYRQYGMAAEQLIRENPYRLAEEIWGIGFVRADAIAREMDVPEDSPFRIKAGLHHLLNKCAEEGHIFVPQEKLVLMAGGLLQVSEDSILSVLEKEIILRSFVREEDRIYSPSLYYPEERVAKWFARQEDQAVADVRAVMDGIHAWESDAGMQFHTLQREAICQALTRRILVITGGPGTGKTTVLKGILKNPVARRRSIALAAPTGRAAKRMEEVTGIQAKTLHRLLEYQPGKGFMRSAGRPLECNLLIIDEVSMVDIGLMDAVLTAMPRRASLVLIGDEDQLPSVGPGQILKDLIRSECIPVIRLSQIFRQAGQSRIVTLAHEIRQGILPNWRKIEGQDFRFFEEAKGEQAAAFLCDLAIRRIPQGLGLDPLRDVQVMSPMRRGWCGTENLNRMLQSAYHNIPFQESRSPKGFIQGDKVMQIRNNYEKQVFNGDIGLVDRMEPRTGTLWVRFLSGTLEYSRQDQEELVLAYAVTIHKSQGNEFPAAVIPVLNEHYVMLYRNLLYTGITRAKQYLFLVGTPRALSMAVKNADPHQRNTTLAMRICNG